MAESFEPLPLQKGDCLLLRGEDGLGHIVDVVEQDFGPARCGYGGVEVADCARGGVARVFERFGGGFIVIFEHGEADNRLALDFEGALIADGHRITLDGEHLRRHVLPRRSVAAGGGAHELAPLVGETHGQPVELILDGVRGIFRNFSDAGEEGVQLVVGDSLVEAVQPRYVLVPLERLNRLAPDAAGGRIEEHGAALPLQRLQFGVQFIVLGIGHGRVVENVILVGVFI